MTSHIVYIYQPESQKVLRAKGGPKTLGKQLSKMEMGNLQAASRKLRSPTGQLFSFPAAEIAQEPQKS